MPARNLHILGDFRIGEPFKGGMIVGIRHRQGQLTAKLTVAYKTHRAHFTLKRIDRFTWKANI